MRNSTYTILLAMNDVLTGKPSKYYLVSYKTDRKGDIFCKYVHDGLPHKAHVYRSYTSALSAAQKVLEKDYRILEVSIIRNFRIECQKITK
ncbi:MAG: hypothetical protein L6V86_08595 [Treponema sp.]|nr:MAG: hypothetical protein L6V86_08595 [Treponema sp.]